jgi:hypothetical protein
MPAATITRKQYPVGHGGFHAGRIAVRNDDVPPELLLIKDIADASTILEKFYVYDCGSESPKAFDRSLQSHNLMTKERTDLLFVSHLDSDHVNKIDRLMGATPARIVVLPYLDSLDLAELLIREVAGGSVTASMREYVTDPVGHWRRQGADIVIFVEPGGGDDQPPGGGPPDRPTDPDRLAPTPSSEGVSSEGLQARLTCTIRKPRAAQPKDFAKVSYGAPHDIDHDPPAGGVLAGCGSYFRLEWRANDRDPWRRADWILLPYVHPVETEIRTAFRAAIMHELSFKNPDSDLFATALLAKLRSDRKRLVELYYDHFEVGQNAISMSLYSGPEGRRGAQESPQWLKAVALGAGEYHVQSSPMGWLGTGDSKLKQSARRTPWLNFFKPFSREIAVLSLPHHGSFKDFDEEILGFDGLVVAVATTIRDRNRVAGLELTLGEVSGAGKDYKVVDDKAESELSLKCARAIKPA